MSTQKKQIKKLKRLAKHTKKIMKYFNAENCNIAYYTGHEYNFCDFRLTNDGDKPLDPTIDVFKHTFRFDYE